MLRIKRFFYNQKVAPYMFVLPFIIIFCAFSIYPMINTILMSFQKVLPGQTHFIGIKNYTRLFSDKTFFIALENSIKYMVITCALLIPFPMLFAAMVNSKHMPFPNFFKAILYLPALASVVVSGTIFRLTFSESSDSLMNEIIGLFGAAPIQWLRVSSTGFTVLIVLCCWRWTGVNIMYFISGLKSIPRELYESAEIDGASSVQQFFKITVPLLKPTTIYVLTISIYAGLAMFTESFMLWNGNNSPRNMGLTIVGYLYRQGIEKNDLGYGSTVGIVLLVAAMIINVVQLKLNGLFKKEAM
ncbi:MAG TPA: sugar ABC transporter permease [Clostridiales bacterium]|nr:sugar ABC transporter permease [Clostridiales bacterium]